MKLLDVLKNNIKSQKWVMDDPSSQCWNTYIFQESYKIEYNNKIHIIDFAFFQKTQHPSDNKYFKTPILFLNIEKEIVDPEENSVIVEIASKELCPIISICDENSFWLGRADFSYTSQGDGIPDFRIVKLLELYSEYALKFCPSFLSPPQNKFLELWMEKNPTHWLRSDSYAVAYRYFDFKYKTPLMLIEYKSTSYSSAESIPTDYYKYIGVKEDGSILYEAEFSYKRNDILKFANYVTTIS